MYWKIFLKLTLGILANLFAFFLVGHILDSLFGRKGTYTLLSILISLVPLLIFMFLFIKSTLQELEKDNTTNHSIDDNHRS